MLQLRKQRQEKREEAATLKIQSVHRGNVGRSQAAKAKALKERREQAAAAQRIQNVARGKQANRELEAMRKGRKQELEAGAAAQGGQRVRRRRRDRRTSPNDLEDEDFSSRSESQG